MKRPIDLTLPKHIVRQVAAVMALDACGDTVRTGDSMLSPSADLARLYDTALAIAAQECGVRIVQREPTPALSYFTLIQIADYGPQKAVSKQRQRDKWRFQVRDDGRHLWPNGTIVLSVHTGKAGRIESSRRGSPINTMHRDLHTPMYLVYWPNTRTSVWMWRAEIVLAPEGTVLSDVLVPSNLLEDPPHAQPQQIAP